MLTMKRPYQITSIVLLLLSAFIIRESLNLRYYTSLGPGPGFFPFWLSVLLAVLSLIMLYQATFLGAPPMPEDFFASRTGYLRALAVCVAIVWTVLTFNPLGFRISMAVLCLWLLITLGRVNWIVTFIITAAGSWGTFWLFDSVLRVPLPIGMWGI